MDGVVCDLNSKEVKWLVEESRHPPDFETICAYHICHMDCASDSQLVTANGSSLSCRKLGRVTNHCRKLLRELRSRCAREKMVCEAGVDVKITPGIDDIFSEENLMQLEDFRKEKEVSVDSLASMIFSKSVRSQRQAKMGGTKSVRHLPLMIKLGCKVLQKVKAPLYKILTKAFSLSSRSQLYKYHAPGTSAPDGIQHEQMHQHQCKMEQLYPSLPWWAWERHGSLSFNAMTVKESLMFDFNTQVLVE